MVVERLLKLHNASSWYAYGMKPKRKYRHVTPELATRFRAEKAIQGSGTAAVEVLEPDYKSAKDRAYQIAKITEGMSPDDYVEEAIEQIAVVAIERVNELVQSTDEHVATKNAHFIIEQRRGKAVQKNQNTNVNLNIQTVLE